MSSLGRIVHYTLNEADAEAINRRRVAKPHTADWPVGAQAHAGNHVQAGDFFPAIVVRVNSDPSTLNLQVFLDGNDVYWAMSIHEATVSSGPAGVELGLWSWPTRV